ncbi:MAG: hypothetical protein ACI865_000973 [Flavobacteriaceae bacterium]|jgi:hypothetical protein
MLGLDSKKIIETISLLEKRISDRFPDSGLGATVRQFLDTANKTQKNVDRISSPNIPVRVLSTLVIAIGLGGLAYSITYIDIHIKNTTLESIITLSEAIFNDLLLLGAAVFFLVTTESRLKRKRAIRALNELRVIAHVIDMHQLTKDPNIITKTYTSTEHSPKRTMTNFELQRYLDYCSETTALIGKVAVLYAQSLPDDVVVRSVNEIEVLTTGLSRKIWQKLVILGESN